jgi:hypothetical protein
MSAAAAADPPALASSAAAAAAAAVASAAGASAGSVFVKRAGDARARFARVPILVGDAVTDLAERASLKLEWRTTAAYVDLFLIKPAGGVLAFATPSQAQIDTVLADEGNLLGEGMPLSLAGVASGAWLVARLSPPPAAAPGECVGARLAASLVLVKQGAVGGSREVRDTAGVFVGRSPLSCSLPFHPLQAAAVAVAAAASASAMRLKLTACCALRSSSFGCL